MQAEEFLLPNDWQSILCEEINKEYYTKLQNTLKEEYQQNICYPPKYQVFNAFELCPFNSVKVVLLGQDPYHGAGQAHGLAFSVPNDIPIPPSLRNIFTELHTDLGIIPPSHGNLSNWAQQGVLLLNSTLTVQMGKPNSHQKMGWNIFTEEVIHKISEKKENVVFILWGNFAQKYKKRIDPSKHFIIESAHPSPLSSYRGFFGSKPFSKTNAFLISKGMDPIDWQF